MKTKINIFINTEHDVSVEQQVEMLAYIRQSLQNFTKIFPDTTLMSGREPSNEEIMEAIRGDSQTKENCFYFDEAQGRHKCTNDLVKSTKCRGVCKHYWSKNRK